MTTSLITSADYHMTRFTGQLITVCTLALLNTLFSLTESKWR